MRPLSYSATISLFLTLLAGCAVDPTKEWNQLSDDVAQRGGGALIWQQGPEDEKRVKEAVNEQLKGGLSSDEAVRIALLNNRRLQARFEDIGIGKADLVQAGLFTNPSLGGFFQFAEGGGTAAEAGAGILPIADIWLVPLKVAAAKAHMQQIILETLDAVLEVSLEAKLAYIDALYAEQAHVAQSRVVEIVRKLQDRIQERYDAGFGSELDLNSAQVELATQELGLAKTAEERRRARATLARTLGLDNNGVSLVLTGSLEREVKSAPALDTVVAEAQKSRADVAASEARIAEAQRILRLEHALIFKNLQAGASYTLEDETNRIGPRLDLQLPIFDQNQAQIAKARYKLRKREKELEDLRLQVRLEIENELAALEFHGAHAKLFKARIEPLEARSERLIESMPMQFTALQLLDAQRRIIESRQQYFAALRDYAAAQARLDRARGRIDVAPVRN